MVRAECVHTQRAHIVCVAVYVMLRCALSVYTSQRAHIVCVAVYATVVMLLCCALSVYIGQRRPTQTYYVQRETSVQFGLHAGNIKLNTRNNE